MDGMDGTDGDDGARAREGDGEGDGQDWLVDGGDDPAAIAEQYDDWAATYDDEVGGWEYRSPEVAAALLVEHGADLEPILDAGCGTGRVGRSLRELGYTGAIDGVDASAVSLEVARGHGVYRELSVVDLQRPLPHADGTFGAVVCVGVMTYVPDVEACWRELARVARSGGTVVATQRDDLWDDRRTQQAIDRLSADGVWQPLVVTGAEPYLPRNADFGTDIGVRYVVARVS